MKKTALSISVFLAALFWCAAGNYSHVDDYVLENMPTPTTDLEKITGKLTSPFDTEAEKARALFVWITHTIDYDVQQFRRGSSPRRIAYRTPEELAEKKQQIREADIKQTLRTKKGVCHDYSVLFEEMGAIAGLECVMIQGYAKIHPSDIGKEPAQNNHAWNAVKINGQWKLLDCTWGSGFVNYSAGKYTRQFTDFYFFTDPEYFVLNHLPDDAQWQLLADPLTEKEFINLPMISQRYFEFGVRDHHPETGILKQRKRKIDFSLEFKQTPRLVYLVVDHTVLDVKPTIKDNEAVINYSFPKRKVQEISLCVKEGTRIIPVVTYKVE